MSETQSSESGLGDGRYLRSETVEHVLVISPLFTFGQFTEPELMSEWTRLKAHLDALEVQKVIVDLSEIPYFGSTVLEWMVEIWKKMRQRKGIFVMCRVSPIGREVLAAARFDQLWQVYHTREQALDALRV